ncbi:hypothetical protein BDY24DRAFT_10405 [Mrakia frigida]|uniref:uncharacterized protein n=1 Tax=Mrakia frigida TaxID=29902 RepID=UPI003FCC096B
MTTPTPSATISELSPPTLDLYSLLSLPLDSELIPRFLSQACEMEQGWEGTAVPEPVVVKYSDIIFHSYHSLGLSLGFSPILPSCPLIQIDLFNPPSSPAPSTTKKPIFHPALRSLLPAPLLRTSTARELLLSELGEPSRKGGGEPNLGRLGLGVWMEWEREREEGSTSGEAQEVGKEEKEDGDKKRGLKVEFDERGAGCWERDRLDKAVWRECGLFLS